MPPPPPSHASVISRNPANPYYGTANETWIWITNGTAGYQGSYSFNGWLYSGDYGVTAAAKNQFRNEADIVTPTLTPAFGDAMWLDAWPLATDKPARNLYEGDGVAGGIGRYCIARHGGTTIASTPARFCKARSCRAASPSSSRMATPPSRPSRNSGRSFGTVITRFPLFVRLERDTSGWGSLPGRCS